jgi:methionine-R-sulfoxide reductase
MEGELIGSRPVRRYSTTAPGREAPATRDSRRHLYNEIGGIFIMVLVRTFNKAGQLVGPLETPKVVLSEDAWRQRLTPEQFQILRSSGTERPFCGMLLDNKKQGVYSCAGCGLPLFSSDAKFNSGTGWPSFFQPIAKENVSEQADDSHGMVRVEVNCARCDGHLGHVFPDGPPPTRLRYCLNSESLKFTPSDEVATLADPAAAREKTERQSDGVTER